MNKERRLGRGLEALLGRPAGPALDPSTTSGLPAPDGTVKRASWPEVAPASAPTSAPSDGLMKLDVHAIDRNPFQPRQDFEPSSIAELAASLREHGLLQPLVVRRAGERYQLIAGERRLRAAIEAGWTEVPCQVREADDRQVAEIAIVENLQRKDLNPLDKAASFQRYLDQYHCTQEELASRLAIDRSTIANLIRLLELPAEVQTAVRSGALTQGHARALLPLGDEREQLAFCKRITEESLSVRATEQLVQEAIQSADASPLTVVGADGKRPKPKRTRGAQVASLEQELRSALGAKVEIKQTAGGRGKIVIHFASHDEFDRLRELITESGTHEQRAVI